MGKDKFNPLEWIDNQNGAQSQEKRQTNACEIQNDVELITRRIEENQIDITEGYSNWLNIGFALADELGERGRDYFHRISRFNPGYRAKEADAQFSKCLNSTGSGITIKTFFQLAKDKGIDLGTPNTKSAKSAKYAKSAKTHNADIAEITNIADSEEDSLPTFSPKVSGMLPEFLQQVIKKGNSEQDADILLLGALTVISSCLPHIYGVYDDRTVYPNLFLFVTARASSGKGRLALCRYLVEPIHNRLREISEAKQIEYSRRLAEYNAAGKKKVDMEKPEQPPMRMLFIPANSSATAVYQVLNDNGGEGLMFETEGDTLANTFSSDYGNYSDGFRKAFHHENISYIRRKDREYVSIANPRLSTLLTGTPRQIQNLITDAENGLFSRFIFYWLDLKLVWNDVFQNDGDLTLDEYFQNLGKEFNSLYILLRENKDLKFSLTPQQGADFNATFGKWQEEYSETCGDEFVATVRRLALVTFRIAMIFSALRIMEDGNTEDDLICNDADYNCAMVIAGVLIQHSRKVFSTLSKAVCAVNASVPKNKQDFFNALPQEFDRQEYIDFAPKFSINPATVDRIISKWCNEGKLEKVAHGRYRKI